MINEIIEKVTEKNYFKIKQVLLCFFKELFIVEPPLIYSIPKFEHEAAGGSSTTPVTSVALHRPCRPGN